MLNESAGSNDDIIPYKTRSGIIRRQNLVIEYDSHDRDDCFQTVRITPRSKLNQMLVWKQLDKGDGRPEYVLAFTSSQQSINDSDQNKDANYGRWSRNLAIKPEQDTRQCFILRRSLSGEDVDGKGSTAVDSEEVVPCLLLTHTSLEDNQVQQN